MRTVRTDLALEAHRLVQESTGKTTAISGVLARDEEREGLAVHRVEILDEEGAAALGKPRGTYLTLTLPVLREGADLDRSARAVAALLEPMLPEEGCILVAGIGNRAMTPDALGPLTLRHLLVTRHLGEVLPQLRPLAGIGAGVLGETGMEVAEWVRGAAERVKPQAVILVDALAARELPRLCTTVQIADSGLVPGSGVGNHRMALDRKTLGVPVISIGVPTVAEGARVEGRPFFVTPEDIDRRVRSLAKILGYGITLAAQPGLTIEDITALLA